MDYGIDISNHQNAISTSFDWRQVADNGVSWVCAKATEGSGYRDPYLAANLAGARGVGLAAGAYHFARPGDPGQQARAFVEYAAPAGAFERGSLAPMLDVEDPGVDDAWISAWIPAVRAAAVAELVLVYASLSYWQTRLHPDEWLDDQVLLWCADYTGIPGNLGGWSHPRLAVHQSTSQGTVPGLPGLIDRDVTVGEYGLADLLIGGDMATISDADLAILLAGARAVQFGHEGVNEAGETAVALLALQQQVAAIQGALPQQQAAILAAIEGITTGRVDVAALASQLESVLPAGIAAELGKRLTGGA